MEPLYSKEEKVDATLPALIQLLQDANKREVQLKESLEQWNRKYHSLYQEHMVIKYGDMCQTCQTTRDITPPGKTYTLCHECGEGKKTVKSLQLDLEKKQEEVRNWQDCYDAALRQITDFPEKKYDG